jgi:hypothetical protein
MRLRPFSVPGQPELQAALNKIVAAINAVGTQAIIGRNGVRAISDGTGVVVELEEQRRPEQPRLYPYVVSRYGTYGISLTPGYIRWTRRRTAASTSSAVQSIQRVPLLDDPSLGLRPVTDSPAPAATLTAGYWLTWLVISPNDVRVKFEQDGTSPSVPEGAHAVAINRFQLVMRSGVPEVSDVEVYDNSVTAEGMENKAAYAVTMTGAASCYVAAGRLAYTDWSGASAEGEPLFALREMTIGATALSGLTASHRVWLKVTYSKVAYEECGVAAGFYSPMYGSIVALTGNPVNTQTEGHVLLAEFRTVKASDGTTDVLWPQQVTEGTVTAPCPTAVSGVCSTSSSDSGGSTSGSDKSTAIVPVPWSPTGYTALFCREAPEVRFDDVISAPVSARINTVAIDPRFLSVCEKGTVRVVSAIGDCGQVLWARKEGGLIRFAVSRFPWLRPTEVRFVVDGVRRGFRNMRFPQRTEEQFTANEAFLNSAYPPS